MKGVRSQESGETMVSFDGVHVRFQESRYFLQVDSQFVDISKLEVPGKDQIISTFFDGPLGDV
jgi:hypothetical protein